jgi:hypothetical protein
MMKSATLACPSLVEEKDETFRSSKWLLGKKRKREAETTLGFHVLLYFLKRRERFNFYNLERSKEGSRKCR